MASYLLNMEIVKRSEGHSAVAGAAYRAAARLVDERLGKTFDYTRKERVLGSEILAPQGVPQWVYDRERLWNEVEAAEKRVDAQLAREVLLATPEELDHAARVELVREFIRRECVDRGMIADIAYHETKSGNPHAHVMLTMRTVDQDGFGNKDRTWNKKAFLCHLRERWADEQNLALARAGALARVDHRSFAERGIVFEPLRHMGGRTGRNHEFLDAEEYKHALRERGELAIANPNAALELLAQGKCEFTEHDIAIWAANNTIPELAARLKAAMLSGSELRRLGKRPDGFELFSTERVLLLRQRGEVLLANPGIAVGEIAEKHAVFTEREVDRYLREAVEPRIAGLLRTAVMDSELLIPLGPNADGELQYTTRNEVELERNLVAFAAKLAGRNTHEVEGNRVLAASAKRSMKVDQEMAFRHVVEAPGDIAVVQGFAGAGKSYMLGAAREAWETAGYNVMGGALAGRAAEELQAQSGIAARTLASWELAWSQGRDLLGRRDVFVVDEAGMVGVRQLQVIARHCAQRGAKLVVVGDLEQLPSIDAGVGMRLLVERVGQVFLTTNFRQQPEWMKAATAEMGYGRAANGLAAYADRGHFREHETQREAIEAMVAAWNETRRHSPNTEQLMLAYRRVEVEALNQLARDSMKVSGSLGENEHTFRTASGQRTFGRGDRIYFLRNEWTLGVKNGSLGTVVDIRRGQISVRLDGEERRIVHFNPRSYRDFDYGYATTVHKSQGATVDQVYVLASRIFDSHSAYVAASRHRKDVKIHWSHEEFDTHRQFATTKRVIRSLARQANRLNALDIEGALEAKPHRRAANPPRYEFSADELAAEIAAAEVEARRVDFARLTDTELTDLRRTLHQTASQPLRRFGEAVEELPQIQGAQQRLEQCYQTYAHTKEAWDRFAQNRPDEVRDGKPRSTQARAVHHAHRSALVDRERAIRRLQKLRNRSAVQREARAQVEVQNQSVLDARAQLRDLLVVIAERRLDTAERRQARVAEKWRRLVDTNPRQAKELMGDLSRPDGILTKLRARDDQAVEAVTKLRRLETTVQRPEAFDVDIARVRPQDLMAAQGAFAEALEQWRAFAESHSVQDVWDARRGHGHGASLYEAQLTAYDRLARLRANALTAQRQERLVELHQELARLEHAQVRELGRLVRARPESPEYADLAATEAELDRELWRARNRLCCLTEARIPRIHLPEDETKLRERHARAVVRAHKTARDWIAIRNELSLEQAAEAREGRGPAAAAHKRAVEAQAERHALGRALGQLDRDTDLERAECDHFAAVQALLAFRRKHPDLAKRAVPGTRAHELVVAERDAAKTMARLARFRGGGRVPEGVPLIEAHRIATNALHEAAAAWDDVKQTTSGAVIRDARQGRGPKASVYKALKRSYEDRRAILLALVRVRAQRRHRDV